MGSSCVAGNGERAQAVARNGDMVCMEQEKGEMETYSIAERSQGSQNKVVER